MQRKRLEEGKEGKNNEAERLREQQAKLGGEETRGGGGGGVEKFCSECVVMVKKEEGLSESELI